MSRYVSLPMYDLVEVQSSTGAILEAIAREVRELGEDVVVGNDRLTTPPCKIGVIRRFH